jgi:bifunctional UDP-N-acetylglucosamine pyrophosphorylase / glucosamine-1-phosphate N-acetyltransferase
MKMPLQVAIFAAGEGKRMRSARPKVLHRLAGRPMLDHLLSAVRSIKPRAICVVFGNGGDEVRATLAATDLTWARQEKLLGTGDALKCALAHLPKDGVTVAMIGDIPLIQPETLSRLAAAADGDRLAVLTATPADPSGLGRIVRDGAGQVRAIVEEKDASPEQRAIGEINAGVLAAPTIRFAQWLARLTSNNAQGEYYLTDVVALAVGDGVAVVAVPATDASEVQGVNDRVQLAAAERSLQRRFARALMHQGVTLADPERIDVRGTLTCGKNVAIDINCVFEGDVTLGDGVSIGPQCILNNVTVGDGTAVAAFSHIEDARIGGRCRVGPYSRIRPATVLGDEVHIGNFVEIKASTIEARSKANHLAYIGDASVGRDVNVGAGTITCNYDGANKHRTVIEDDVHIGSDTQLIAPVTVRKGATIGAGATISREVPAGELTISQKKQVVVPGWKRPRKAQA